MEGAYAGDEEGRIPANGFAGRVTYCEVFACLKEQHAYLKREKMKTRKITGTGKAKHSGVAKKHR